MPPGDRIEAPISIEISQCGCDLVGGTVADSMCFELLIAVIF